MDSSSYRPLRLEPFFRKSRRDEASGRAKKKNEQQEEDWKEQDQRLKGAFTEQSDLKGNIHSAEFFGRKEADSGHPAGLHITSANTVINFS